MRQGILVAAVSVSAVLLLATSSARMEAVPVASTDPVEVTCTFRNPSHAGACVEVTTRQASEEPAAACRPILDCLNDLRCVKTYCRSTSIRQGWTLASAE